MNGARNAGRMLAALAVACLACADDGGPTGAPGGRNGIELLYATPRLRVVPAGAESSVRVALVVRRQGEDGESLPLEGARLVVAREEGRGILSGASTVTGPDGLAAIDVRMPAEPDLTRLVFRMESDARSWLPFDVVTAPIVEADLDPGTIRERLDVPKGGVLIRFHLTADSEVLLIPYQTDVDRTGASYRLLYQGAQPGGGAAAFGAKPPPQPQGLALGEEMGDVVTEAGRRGSLGGSAVAQSLDIRSCRVSTSRHAPLRYLGTRVALYVDAPPDAHQARIDSIGRAFDEEIFPTNQERFGNTPDYDGNGVVIVILTPALEGVDGVYCDSIRKVSAEALYVKWAATGPAEQVLSTLAHEHQHLINAGYHLLSNGNVGDVRWLNEAMSFAAEAYGGYWRKTLLRTWQVLNGQNGGLSLLPLDYAQAFDDRYMAFAVYLEDRFGPGALRALSQSGRRGIDNIEFVTGVPFEDLLRDWFIALAVSNRGITDDPRFTYRTIDLQGMGAEIEACGCLPVTALSGMRAEPLHLSLAFDAARMLDRADADYYRLVPPAGAEGTYDVYFDAFGREFVELAVARTR